MAQRSARPGRVNRHGVLHLVRVFADAADENQMNVDVDLAEEAIFWRGMFINRYSGVEHAVAVLVTGALKHPAYASLGQPPFGPAKKMKRLRAIVAVTGPVAPYQVKTFLDEFEKFEEYRHFMAHAMMVPRSKSDITFKMYDHREGEYGEGTLKVSLDDMKHTANRIQPISSDFSALVAKICREVPLMDL